MYSYVSNTANRCSSYFYICFKIHFQSKSKLWKNQYTKHFYALPVLVFPKNLLWRKCYKYAIEKNIITCKIKFMNDYYQRIKPISPIWKRMVVQINIIWIYSIIINMYGTTYIVFIFNTEIWQLIWRISYT